MGQLPRFTERILVFFLCILFFFFFFDFFRENRQNHNFDEKMS